jgi:AcrR family transcriptional regulator
MTQKLTKAAQREATIQRLLAIARDHFTRLGYAHTATEDIVREAGVTRGALYHHFESKQGLFEAVVNVVQAEVAARIEAAATAESSLWGQFVAGCHAFLAVALDPTIQRILLIDAPAVLGWERWREIDAEHGTRSLYEILTTLQTEGVIRTASVDALTHLLTGAMNEAALWIARGEQPEQALDDASRALEEMLNALRTPRGTD